MPSTYTTNNGLELMATGENAGTWGTKTNTSLDIVDRLTTGVGAISLSGTTFTLTTTDATLSDGHYRVLVFGGSPSGTNTVTITPNDQQKYFIVKNNSGQSVVMTQGSGGNVTIADGKSAIVYADGAGAGAAVVDVTATFNFQPLDAELTAIAALATTDGNFIVGDGSTWVAESGSTARTSLGLGSIATQAANNVSISGGSITGITDLAVSDGGTGASSFTANNVLLGNGTSAFQVVAPGTSGNVLTSNGTTWTSAAAPAGYTNSDVDAHLNTSTATTGEVLSWNGTDYDWVSGGATNIDGLSDAAKTSTGMSLGKNSAANGSLHVGVEAGGYSAGAAESVFLGYQTNFFGDTGAAGTVAVGYRAGRNVRALRTIALGREALGSISGAIFVTGSDNIGIGFQTGFDLTTGANNFLGGYQAGTNLTTGSNNVAIGNGALDAATTGGTNVAIGQNAMGSGVATAASGNNVAVGVTALNAITSGTDNVGVGNAAGSTLTTGANNTLLGNGAAASSATVSNEITLGNTSVTRFRVPGCGIDNTSTSLSGTTPSVDVGARDTYTLTTSGNTTFTFTGAPSSGQVGTFSLIITAGGTHTLTWPASVDWAGGSAPAAPANTEVDIYTFMTVDGGTTWYGFLAGDDMS